MRIESTMDLQQLAERMGEPATAEEARAMRSLLIAAGFDGQRTEDVPERAWAAALDAAAKNGALLQAAEDWYNSTPKAELLAWATAHGVDIGQHGDELDPEWNEKIIGAYARGLQT